MSDPDEQDQIREQLREFGMTDEELQLWYDLAALAGRLLLLPEQHPSERSETVVDLHHLQTRLLARPGMRAAGWAQPER
jgi:hypothetical protein